MPVFYKFIAVQSTPGLKIELEHKSEEFNNETINYGQVKSFFLNLGKEFNINEDDLTNTKFIIENKNNMSLNSETDFEIKTNENKIVFVFTVEKETRKKLLDVFNKYGFSSKSDKVDPKITKPIPEEEIKITSEIIEKSNRKTLELFGDSDFITLVEIYKRNPDIFKSFSSYVCNGDVIVDSFEKDINDSKDYTNEFNFIKTLNLNVSDEKINDALKKSKGHYNLTLRILFHGLSSNTS